MASPSTLRAELCVQRISTLVVMGFSLIARRTQQHDEDFTGMPTGLPDDEAQHAATAEEGSLF